MNPIKEDVVDDLEDRIVPEPRPRPGKGKKRNYQPGLTSGYTRFPLPFHSQAPFLFCDRPVSGSGAYFLLFLSSAPDNGRVVFLKKRALPRKRNNSQAARKQGSLPVQGHQSLREKTSSAPGKAEP